VVREASEVLNVEVTFENVLQVVRIMEDDGLVQVNERAQSIFVRTGIPIS
jgi:hypothetical protein